MKKLTSISILTTPEGRSLSYTYSEIDGSGVIVKSNLRESFIVLDNQLLNTIDSLEKKIIADKINK